MAMIFPVCPCCFQTSQALAVRADKPGGAICITDKIFFRCDSRRILEKEASPLNLKKWHVIKTLSHISFHLFHVVGFWCCPVPQFYGKFCSRVILLEIHASVVIVRNIFHNCFFWVSDFPRLLRRAVVALDDRPMIIHGFSLFLRFSAFFRHFLSHYLLQ